MSKLAIRGHATRGREVIELLEMLGGNNKYKIVNAYKGCFYRIAEDMEIYGEEMVTNPHSTKTFTLEKFEKEFPYKVGDKVTYDGDKANIVGMVWDNDINDVFYEIQVCDDVFKCSKVLLQPYKEETMEEKLEQIILEIPAGYEFFGINDDNKVVLTKKQLKHPQTYEECCEIMGIDVSRTIEHDDCTFYKMYKSVTCYEHALLSSLVHLRKLLICRNAYWKIAGEEMGLNKPWEPDWTNNYQKKWITNFYQSEINFTTGPNVQFILAFPTEEMRDEFYENFKELIEQCKELL